MLLRTAIRQVKDGHTIIVVLPEDGPLKQRLEDAGVQTEIIKYDPTIRKRMFKSIKLFSIFMRDMVCTLFVYPKLIKKYHVNIIHSNSSQTMTGGYISKICKIPHIYHVRESYAGFGLLGKLYKKYLLNSSDGIVCVSQAMADQFPVKELNRKVVVVHDGFYKEEFTKVPDSQIQSFREKYNINGYILVGLVGRIILQRKGQDVFVQSISLLKDKLKSVKFLIVGACFPGNEYHLEQLMNLIKELDVGKNVILTGELLDMGVVYSSLDISVMASATPEPFGGVTIESMAYGKPVIGTNIGGTPEQIDDDVTGILIPPNDPVAMADAIESLVNNPEKRKEMGKASQNKFEQEFTFDPYYQELNNSYNLFLSI